MKLNRIVWIVPVVLSAGCVSHRPLVYNTEPTVSAPVSDRQPVRVYPTTTTTTTVVDPPPTVVTTPRVVTTTPSVVTTVPGTTYTTPVIITDAPANVSPTAGIVAANNAVAEKIRSLLIEDAYLNSATRDVRFSVYDGRVTMTGRTGTSTQRERIHAAIAALPGVYQVEDRVELNLGR